MPIQQRLDTSPLPMTAKEFEKMPKAKCINCQVYVPVQLLALHIDKCEQNSSTECKVLSDDESSLDESDELDSSINESSNEPPTVAKPQVDVTASLNETPSASSSLVDVKVACPVCSEWYPKEYVEIHASCCGESLVGEFEKETEWEGADKNKEKTREEKPCRSLSDIITQLADKVDSTSAFNISVTRGELFERGMLQWKRQKKIFSKEYT
ncbi:uncharacterized protein LOC107683690 [Sinocyclocheilus anshuiensis]|uniref:uncharacterized protein LOC107683690 n=1 Tax=Sinocyclocheilus anshuiensis TaxID=1608454 RepID=UPI0007B9EADD|nr:PREDICTED: uncharacterized protein LOC107683690 [Sinocyclocheilus anshuiensis]